MELDKGDIASQEHFPCNMGGMTTKTHRIITLQQSIIPPNTEMIVSAIVIDKNGTGTMGIIKGQQKFLQDYPIAVAAVVTCKTKNSVPVQQINARPNSVRIRNRIGIAMFLPGEV